MIILGRSAVRIAALALSVLLLSGVSAAQSIPELFQKAKEEIKAGSWADAQKSLDALDAESSKPGNEVARKQLEAPMAFYGGVCASGLGKTDEAVASFEAFLKLQPNASIDKTVYSKKAVAAFEKAEKAGANRAPSLAEAYKEFQAPADAAERHRADQYWGSGPAQWIMTAQEKAAWSALADPNARVEFVETFWEAREPDYRRQFEKRVAFADASLAVDAESRGSLTDRGMVFVLLGPPTYAGRKPLRTGDDASDSAGMSTVGSQDWETAQKAAKAGGTSSAKLAQLSVGYGGPGKSAPGSSENKLEVWHYRRELLPKGVPYQQVDCEFVTRKGYGSNVLQREPATLNTLEAARSAGTKPAS